ncbi:MAG: hypothetical protein AAGI38_12955, partial [Bacteroidota bacterium]
LQSHEVAIQRAFDQLLGFVTPAMNTFRQLASQIENGTPEDIVELVIAQLCSLLEALQKERVEAMINQLLDVVEQDLEALIRDLLAGLINPVMNLLIERLKADFNGGDTSRDAFNCFMLANALDRVRLAILTTESPFSGFDRNLLVEPLLALMDRGNFWELSASLVPKIQTSKAVYDKIYALVNAFAGASVEVEVGSRSATTRNGEGEEEEKTHYLWYASWLLGDDYWKIGTRITKNSFNPIFDFAPTLDGQNMIEQLDNEEDSARLYVEFAGNDIMLDRPMLTRRQDGGVRWFVSPHEKPDEVYTIIYEEDRMKVFKGKVYENTNWWEMPPMRDYTFDTISPETCEKIAFHTDWIMDLAHVVEHSFSMEPTADTGPNSDMFSNLVNILQYTAYGLLKLSGPHAFNWGKKDIPMKEFWLKWVIPSSTTFFTSFEGIHTNVDNPLGTRTIFWLTLLGADLSEFYLYNYWNESARTAVLSFVTLLNYDGPKTNSSGEDNRPKNKDCVYGVANLFMDASTWILAATLPHELYGIPNGNNGQLWGPILGHWLGWGALSALVGAFTGTVVAECISWCEDWWALGKMLLISIPITWAKFPFYWYIVRDGDTNGGTYLVLGDGTGGFNLTNPFPGYPAQDTSPYLLPYPGGEVLQCAQGHNGLWSHTPHSGRFQGYAVDFAHDFNDPVTAIRAGIVVNFIEGEDDGNPDDSNNITVLHTGAADADHDFDRNGNTVPTTAVYVHGVQNSITPLLQALNGGQTIALLDTSDSAVFPNAQIDNLIQNFGIDPRAYNPGAFPMVVDAMGVAIGPIEVAQGDAVMGGGDTGRSAYNHLHLLIRPTELGDATLTDGATIVPDVVRDQEDYSIPFVFADVNKRLIGTDGVPRALNYYESQNAIPGNLV